METKIPIFKLLSFFQGGVLNYTGDISFLGSGHRVSIRQRYYGMDVFDQLKMDAIIQGNVPYLSPGSKPFMTDHSVIYNRVSPGNNRLFMV